MKLTIDQYELNDIVDVTPTKSDDFWEFTGHIVGFDKNLIQVIDQEGDTFDVDVSQIELSSEDFCVV